MINLNCWRQPIPVSVYELPTVARLIYQELLLNAARNDSGGTFTTSNGHHYKLEHGQCFFSDLSLSKILNRDPKTIEKWRKYLEKMGNSMGNRVGDRIQPIIRSRPCRDGRIYTLLDYDKITGMGNSVETKMGSTVGNSMGTDIRLQNTYTLTYEEKREPKKIVETKNLITEQNGEKKIQPILLAQEPFLPKVPGKGISPAKRSDALVGMIEIAKEFGCVIRWDTHENEIKEAVELLGLDQLLKAMRDYTTYCAGKGFTQIYWPKFKANRLNDASPKEQIDRVKKAPEYQQDRTKQLEKRGTVSYASLPNMSKISDIYSMTSQVGEDPKKAAFIARAKRLEGLIQRPNLSVGLGMVNLDAAFYVDFSDEDIVQSARKILDKKLDDAVLLKLPKKSHETVGRSELKSYLENLKRSRVVVATS